MSYVEKLENNDILLSNLVQGTFWKSKKEQFRNRLLLPLLLYQDDFETNNALGSARGLGKIGAVYCVIPCLAPHMQSKTEKIFVLTLCRSEDQKKVSLRKFYEKAVAELAHLGNAGSEISTKSGPVRSYFSLAGVIGDTLAVHILLGFVRGFTANHPCRFCLIHYRDMSTCL